MRVDDRPDFIKVVADSDTVASISILTWLYYPDAFDFFEMFLELVVFRIFSPSRDVIS